MFGLLSRPSRPDPVGSFHARIVAASRDPGFYGEGGFPDSMEGRFESLLLHTLLVLRRLRALPAPAADVAQDLVDAVFAHLEIALREMGVGDFGVPKRMKKLGRAFYDRMSRYDPLLDGRDTSALAREIGARLDLAPELVGRIARHVLDAEPRLARQDLDRLMVAPDFGEPAHLSAVPARRGA